MKNYKKKRKLRRALLIIKEAFDANCEAHNTWDYGESQKWYGLKARKVREAIELIKEHSLRIKYGYGFDSTSKEIIYFSFGGEQCSFHFFDSFRGVKKYHGAWKGTVNQEFPLPIV